MANAKICVWTFLSAKKQEKIGFPALLELSESRSMEFVLMNPLDKDTMEAMKQRSAVVDGRKHVVLHKISDFIKEGGDDSSVDMTMLMSSFSQLLTSMAATGADVRAINGMEGVQKIADRWITYRTLSKIPGVSGIRMPETVLLPSEARLAYPVLWKPVSACGHPTSHSMSFLPTPTCTGSTPLAPGILQQFIPHYGVLYKVFVVGSRIHVDIRPSLCVSSFEGRPHTFDSVFIRGLPSLTVEEERRARGRLDSLGELVIETSKRLSEGLGLCLFGWDMIIAESEGQQPYIIDVNNFPKFDGFPAFHSSLLDLLLD